VKNTIKNNTKIEMLCELAHNRVLEECETNLALDENGDYTMEGQDLFDEFYDYYESIILTYLKEK
tara:strand:+ start:509 stop:703 length:195 start_codon:yes stop_codon:yes gene_type:complete